VLFERSKPVLLTPVGDEIVRRARAILAGARQLQSAAQTWSRPFTGPLRMGVIPTIAPYLLPLVLPRVRATYPDWNLALHEAQTEQLVALTLRGELDLVLVALEADLGGLTTYPVFDDPFIVSLPTTHRLAGRKRLRESDLRGETILLLTDGHCLTLTRPIPTRTVGLAWRDSSPRAEEFKALGALLAPEHE
jgi:LysR family transcriptional regulator, hydrogen peroxide-inducible genes activator